jgi:hypothetical protein
MEHGWRRDGDALYRVDLSGRRLGYRKSLTVATTQRIELMNWILLQRAKRAAAS